jgi:hypothetical protein
VAVVPAHDEELTISDTLEAIAALDHPPDLLETVVVADNCTDRTAVLARDAGATVWTRDEPGRTGKGAALGWALDRVAAERPRVDAVLVIDADCHPSRNLLVAVAARMREGAGAVQASYLVANPERSPATALRYAAFASMNHARPRGKSALGLSCGLLGTGMAFSPALLERVPWTADGLTEDGEQHLNLVEAGERVVFAPEAAVTSAMPASAAGRETQQLRWERGRVELACRRAPRLLIEGARRGDVRRLHAGFDVMVPPQSLLAAATAATMVGGLALRLRTVAAVAAGGIASQVLLAIGGLRLVHAPATAYRALAHAPTLIAAKLLVYARIALARGPAAWERTPRDPETS